MSPIEDKFIPPVAVHTIDGIKIVSVYPWVKTCTSFMEKFQFTNAFKNVEEYADKVTYVLTQLIPKVNKDATEIFELGRYHHCHKLDDVHAEKARKIAAEIQQIKFGDLDSQYEWWELGFTGSIRLIGVYYIGLRIFYPMFCDWQHLLFPSEKYNQRDYKKFSYSPNK